MALIVWDDYLSVGSPTMDDHHKRLFDIINNMHDAMKTGEAEGKIIGLIDDLIDYTVFHFTAEEKLMAQHGYTGLEAQKRAHQAFADKMLELKSEADDGMAIFVVGKVSKVALDWLKEHITVMDMQYENVLKGL